MVFISLLKRNVVSILAMTLFLENMVSWYITIDLQRNDLSHDCSTLRVFVFFPFSMTLLELFYIKTHDCIQKQDRGRGTDLVIPPSNSALKYNGKGQLTAIIPITPSLPE